LTRDGNLGDIIEWIENGASDHFLDQGFLGFYPGRFFAQRQVIKMPAYKQLVSPEETKVLAEFLQELLSTGPLTAEGILSYRPTSTIPSSEPAVQSRDTADGNLFDEVAAILSGKCLECHGPEKQKSGYRLDLGVEAMRGGEISEFLEKAAIVPGNSKNSLLIQFVEALEEDLDREIYPMPPEGRSRLSDAEVNLLKRWIDLGAQWPVSHQLEPLNK
jgi:hypothetical protein